jgi:hypothetical protein
MSSRSFSATWKSSLFPREQRPAPRVVTVPQHPDFTAHSTRRPAKPAYDELTRLPAGPASSSPHPPWDSGRPLAPWSYDRGVFFLRRRIAIELRLFRSLSPTEQRLRAPSRIVTASRPLTAHAPEALSPRSRFLPHCLLPASPRVHNAGHFFSDRRNGRQAGWAARQRCSR